MFRPALALGVLAHCVHSQNPSPEKVHQKAVERRAVEAVIWGMPMINYDLMYQAAVQNKSSWKNQLLTPNPGAVCLMPFYNTGVFLCVFQAPSTWAQGSIT
jgi:hypothetical protein